MTKKSAKRLGFKEFLLALFLMVVLWGAQQLLGLDLLTGDQKTPVAVDPSVKLQVLFTTPRYPDKQSDHYGGLDVSLATAIDAAKKTVDVAAYDFDLARVADALVRADQRGVQVRLVTDSDYQDELGPTELRRVGIPIVTDDRDPFMHDKFVVIDGKEVWTGSWNLTDNGTYRNNNNAVVIHATQLAQNYTGEFDEMFEDRAFGSTSDASIAYPFIDLDGTEIETTFEAEGDARARIITLLEDARSSVRFMVFIFTDGDMARTIIDCHDAGIDVAGVIEARNVESMGSEYDAFRNAGVDVLEDGNPYIMHHKVIVIDDEIVITGSYNFTASAANDNDENVLIIHSADVAADYLAEFDRVYTQAQAPPAEN